MHMYVYTGLYFKISLTIGQLKRDFNSLRHANSSPQQQQKNPNNIFVIHSFVKYLLNISIPVLDTRDRWVKQTRISALVKLIRKKETEKKQDIV